jgi:eukaryotic-like serine/threonine-protein kinase
MATDLERLIERLLAGDLIAPESIAPELLEQPEVQRLLRLSRVMAQLEANAATSDSNENSAAAAAPARLGPFKLERRLGVGGMGEVWLGLRDDGQAEQRVAIKRVRGDTPNFAERLRSERRILARLEHAHIARFIDAGVDAGGAPWLALEYVDGVAITDYCAREGLGLQARLRLFQKVCAAVDHAHGQLVVHRDLKPGNVLVGADGEPKLLDFGIARLLDDSQAEATSSALTPAYAAPEQLRGEPVSTATDVYALGLLLFRLLAGQLPPGRRRGSLVQALEEIGRESQQRPSEQLLPEQPFAAAALRGDLDAIVGQALRAEPAQRYRSARELGEDIQRHLRARPVRARPPTRRYRFSRFVRRNAAAVGFAALAALALLAGTAVALEQARRATAAAQRAEAEALAARQAQARAEQASSFLESLFREQDPFARAGSSARSPQQLLAEGVARAGTELAGDAEGQVRLLRVLAEAQFGQGLTADAQTSLQRARAVADAHPVTAQARLQLDVLGARIAEAELRQDDALALYARALSEAKAQHGEDSLELARIQRDQARVLLVSGDFGAALAAAEAAHAQFLRQWGADHPETALARYQMGLVHEQKREDPAAREDFIAVLAVLERAYGEDDARLVRPLMSLGDAQRRLREFDAGRSSLMRGAAIAALRLGAQHAQHAAILIRLGTLERDAGDLDAAIDALDAAQAALPTGEVQTLAQLHASRGALFIARAEFDRAEPDLRQAMELRKQHGGLRTGLAWYSQAEWGVALAGLGRLEEAEAAQREARRELLALLGPDAYQNSLIAARLGDTLAQRGAFAEAAAELAEAERLVVAQAGPDSHNACQYRLQRAQALAQLPSRRDEARALVRDLQTRAVAQPELRAALESKGLATLTEQLARH